MSTEEFNGLPAHVWPRTAHRREDGGVTIGGVALKELAQEYGTPLMVIDEEDFRSRCCDMASAFGGPERVHYASKSFLNREVARWVKNEGLSMDVASEYELAIALAADFPASRITAHGNNKSPEFLRACVREGVGHVVIDHWGEITQLNEIAAELRATQPVMVRVKPGVEAHTNEMIATAHEDQKFGFSLATGASYKAAAQCVEASNLELVGLHCHIGSQIFDAEGFSLAAERVLELYARIRTELRVQLPELDLGGGYGIAYTSEQQPLDVAAVAADLLAAVDKHAREEGIPAPTVLVEPGRAISGPAGVTVYTVGAVKDTIIGDEPEDTRRYVAVDGGMSDNIRPALYGAEYDGRMVNRHAEGVPVRSRIVGSHCESGDILIRDIALPEDVGAGDLFALAATGAYSYAMSSNYNMLPKPAVVAVREGEARLILRRQTVEDYLSLEPSES